MNCNIFIVNLDEQEGPSELDTSVLKKPPGPKPALQPSTRYLIFCLNRFLQFTFLIIGLKM